MGVLSHSGSLVIVFLRPSGPTWAVRISYASEAGRGELGDMKSLNEGPVFSLSLNLVVRLGASGLPCGICESTVVARKRENCETEGERDIEVVGDDANKHRARGIEEAIVRAGYEVW
jgi:hypothetical protein